MGPGEVEAGLREIMTARLGVDPAAIAPAARLVEDLGLDSLDAVELAMAAERRFQVGIAEEQLAGLHTVADVVALVARLRGERVTP
jgi:acyl carrier protein